MSKIGTVRFTIEIDVIRLTGKKVTLGYRIYHPDSGAAAAKRLKPMAEGGLARLLHDIDVIEDEE
jgi:hypothetical protein